MRVYPTKIGDHVFNPRNTGEVSGANAVGKNVTFMCGCFLEIGLRIEKQQIMAAKFRTNGCGFMMAAADLLTEILQNKELTDLKGLDRLEKEIEKKLGEFPAERRHCLKLPLEVLQSAFQRFRSLQIEEWIGEKALICTCFGVSEETIEGLVKEKGCESVEEVSRICQAGSGCGSCQPLIQEIIDDYVIISP